MWCREVGNSDAAINFGTGGFPGWSGRQKKTSVHEKRSTEYRSDPTKSGHDARATRTDQVNRRSGTAADQGVTIESKVTIEVVPGARPCYLPGLTGLAADAGLSVLSKDEEGAIRTWV